MIDVRPALEASDIEAARALFREYVDAFSQDADFAMYLGQQGFAAEVAGLPGIYAPPSGVILLAWEEGAPAGCVACKPLDPPRVCEMKRLYVRPAFRGRRVGEHLIRGVLVAGQSMGYQRMRLDTLPSMPAAQRLYARFGFREIPAYVDNPVWGARFMELALDAPLPPA